MTDRIYDLEKALIQKDHVIEDCELKIVNLEVQCEIISKDWDSLNEALQYQYARYVDESLSTTSLLITSIF